MNKKELNKLKMTEMSTWWITADCTVKYRYVYF